MNFGVHMTSEADAFSIMDQALELGINFFDSANVYGGKPGAGVTETILGNWFSQGGGRREKTVLATKVYGKMGEWPNESRLSALNIRRACDASLKRLKTDYIDLYQMHHIDHQMHHIDRNSPWEEIWQAMETLVQQGKVLYVGSSNFAGWHIAQANEAAKQRHFMGLVSEQSLYNLAARTIELEVLPACQSYGLGMIPWSPLHGGMLGGALKKAAEGRHLEDLQKRRLEQHRPQLEQYEAFCDEIGEHPADVALAWMLHNPIVTSPIIGPRTAQQLSGSLRALEIKMNDEQMKRLDAIWPGPGGAAPEAYAW